MTFVPCVLWLRGAFLWHEKRLRDRRPPGRHRAALLRDRRGGRQPQLRRRARRAARRDRPGRGRRRHQVPELHRRPGSRPAWRRATGSSRRTRSGTQWDTFDKLDKLSDRRLQGAARARARRSASPPSRRPSTTRRWTSWPRWTCPPSRSPPPTSPATAHRARGARGQAHDPVHGHVDPGRGARRRSRSAARAGNDEVVLLHCTLKYPCPPEGINLRMMEHLMRAFPGVPVGLSDHSLGISVPQAAVALGACMVEKHYTVDKTLPGSPDHHLSVDPRELRAMVDGIRTVEKALGKALKGLEPLETDACRYARRSVTSARRHPARAPPSRARCSPTSGPAPASAPASSTWWSDAWPASTSPRTRPSPGRWCEAHRHRLRASEITPSRRADARGGATQRPAGTMRARPVPCGRMVEAHQPRAARAAGCSRAAGGGFAGGATQRPRLDDGATAANGRSGVKDGLRVLAVIPARGGTDTRPLPQHQAARRPRRCWRTRSTPPARRRSVDRVIVSTDDARVADVARAPRRRGALPAPAPSWRATSPASSPSSPHAVRGG